MLKQLRMMWSVPRAGTCRFAGKIFVIGLSGTGTRSLHRAFLKLGIRACQYPSGPDDFERYQALSDIPVACRFKTLDVLYPGSKFILTFRELENWLDNRSRKPEDRSPTSFWVRENRHLTYGRQSFERDAYIALHRDYHAEVAEYFGSRPKDLLTMNVIAGDGWEKLCPFIDAELFKRASFPHVSNPHSPRKPSV
jgi:hypothetical protein